MKGSCLCSSREKLLLGSLTSATYLAADCTPNKKFSTTATKRISCDGMKHRLYVIIIRLPSQSERLVSNFLFFQLLEIWIILLVISMSTFIGKGTYYVYWSLRILISQGELKLSHLIHFYFSMRLHLEKISNKMEKFLVSFSLVWKTVR